MKVGLLGLGEGGELLADALRASSWCELVAVGARKADRIQRFREKHPRIAVYDDYRSCIVENRLDALFVAIPPFLRAPYLSLAAEMGLPVWMLTPAARRFDEALEVMARFERAGCPLVVSRGWGVDPALEPDALGAERMERVFFARGNVMSCLPEDLDWRGDSVRAGGGVLLDRGYALIDTTVQIMGTPSTVYAAAAGVSRPGGRFPYDTEDTAAVICRFSGGGVAVLSACWTSGPESWSLDLHGTAASLHMDRASVTLRDRPGGTQLGRQELAGNPFLPRIEAFLAGLVSEARRLGPTLRDHLPTMAVVQAAYLSARTRQPESPSTIFRMHDIEGTEER